MIGFKDDNKIIMEEIKTNCNDILAIEGKIKGSKVRIILIYMDSTKKLKGPEYNKNKKNTTPSRKTFRSHSRCIFNTFRQLKW